MLTLKEWRRARNISQEAVADACNVHVNTYRRWEENPEQIPFGQAMTIADFIGVRFGEINFLPEKSTENVELPKEVT